jgi:Fe-S cluster assembly protein SufD
MPSNLLFNSESVVFDNYDNNSKTLTIKDVENETYYLIFDNYVPETLTINVINSKVSIIENYKGNLNQCHFIINVDKTSSLNRFSIFVDNKTNQKISREINNHNYYQSMQIDLTSQSVKSDENINLNKQEAYASVVDGIYAINNATKKYQTNLNHYEANCESKAQIFAINNDNAHVSIFTDAYVKNKAVRTVTNQEGRIINLSDSCSGIVLPNLHIDENDVEASHSCSVGSVNEDHVYYLTSRGLTTLQARNILIKGYFNPILENISNEEIKNHIVEVLEQRIG